MAQPDARYIARKGTKRRRIELRLPVEMVDWLMREARDTPPNGCSVNVYAEAALGVYRAFLRDNTTEAQEGINHD